MILCYIDESGTPDVPGNTSHYVLARLAIPIAKWKFCEGQIHQLKQRYQLGNSELHTGWILWPYLEQSRISNFESLSYSARRQAVEQYRNAELLRLQGNPNRQKQYHKTKKNYKQTNAYTHLTYNERKQFVLDVAKMIGSWTFCRLFSECIDKLHFSSGRTSVDEQAFQQVVSRFEQYLQIYSTTLRVKQFGLLIHDNNQTVCEKHTQLMKKFHKVGTGWTLISNIIETPFFVDSELTSMVQLADLCAYALRRYLEKSEDTLFKEIYKIADTKKDRITNKVKVVGIRHYSSNTCDCEICENH